MVLLVPRPGRLPGSLGWKKPGLWPIVIDMMPQRNYSPPFPPDLEALCQEEGLSLLGLSPKADWEDQEIQTQERAYEEWLARGYQGEMGFLERHAGLKFRPDSILPGCRTVIMVGLNYYQERQGLPRGKPSAASPGKGLVARYAWGRDYHKVLGKRLRRLCRRLEAQYPGGEFRSFTDAGPLAEVQFGQSAQLGFRAKNTLLISSHYGSWFFLGEILATREWDPPAPGSPQAAHGACPRGCRKCLDICPTGALVQEGLMDARRCISYLTIEHPGIIPEELRPSMGTWVFGCDLCQEICPFTLRARPTAEEDFLQERAGQDLDLETILNLEDQESFLALFAGTALVRTGRLRLIRNACIAAANGGAQHLVPRLAVLAQDPEPLVSEHARWALEVLQNEE